MGDLTVTFDNAEAVTDVAPLQGIIAGTVVLTLEGEIPVQFLAPGDRVITRSGAKKLQSVEVAVVRDAAMVRVSASSLGHERPEADLFVAPSQQILVRDWRAKALYNKDVAMVEAQRLADGEYIRKEVVAEVRLFTLRFEREEVVYAGGLELACAPALINA
jgi:Hint domain